MMINEERAASRAICDAATDGEWERKNTPDYAEVHNSDTWGKSLGPIALVRDKEDAEFIAHARTALPAALDALDEMEILIDAEKAKRPIEIKGEAAKSVILAMELGRMEADRDYWKEQAQALERAIRQSSICCFLCINDFNSLEQEPCKSCKKKANWEFDQERFKSGL